MSIDRSEFDELVQRVANLERRHDAAMELIAAELVGLRSHIDAGLDELGGAIEDVRSDIGRVVVHVNESESRLSAKLDANHGVLSTILRRIEGDES
jgi:hypothetical protein